MHKRYMILTSIWVNSKYSEAEFRKELVTLHPTIMKEAVILKHV